MDKARVVSLFISVVRAKSFSQAAVDAGLTPQAVSKAIRQLELHLGVSLFHRTTRSLSLTEHGTRLFELAHPGLRLLDEALDQIRHCRLDLDGLIRIAAPVSIGNALIVPLLAEFQQRYPGAHCEVHLGDMGADVTDDQVDVGLFAGGVPEGKLVCRQLGEILLAPCAAPSYLALHGRPQALSELPQHRCIGLRHPVSGRLRPWQFQLDGTTQYQELPAVASFNTVEAQVTAVLSGLGIGQLPLYLVEAELASGALVTLLPQTACSHSAVSMVYSQRSTMPLRVRQFIDLVGERAPQRLAAQQTRLGS